jgi:hypothetical protein
MQKSHVWMCDGAQFGRFGANQGLHPTDTRPLTMRKRENLLLPELVRCSRIGTKKPQVGHGEISSAFDGLTRRDKPFMEDHLSRGSS